LLHAALAAECGQTIATEQRNNMHWALIAGGSRGIGYHIAEALAARKYNIALVARNSEDLVVARNDIERAFPVQVEIFSSDLSLPDAAVEIASWCSEKAFRLTVLCNAAGRGGSKDYLSLPIADLRNMVRLNIESAIELTLALLPLLQKNAPSAILNIGSVAGFTPIPAKNIYSASRAALLFFSYSLRYQLTGRKISVSCCCPGPVFTKPSIEAETLKQLGWFGRRMAVDPARVAEMAVRNMLKGKMLIVPGMLSTLVSFILRLLPAGLLARIFYQSAKQN
jgi:short-subunit dehydrogenase